MDICAEYENGNCYQAAAEYALDHPQAILVHGEPKLTREPWTRFAHAWVEVESLGFTWVIDVSNGNDITCPAFFYYEVGSIKRDECVEYTHTQLMDQLKVSGHWGPWDHENKSEKNSF